jgi:hypothetical protein
MDRLPEHWTWTAADEHTSWRKWAGWKHNLDDPVVLPFHLRELSAADREHAASDDEEGSRVLLRVNVVRVVQVIAVAGLVIVGVRAVRSLMGAS